MLVATARSLSAAEETVAQIRARGGEAEYLQCDVCDEASVEAMVAKTVELFGSVDFAFNNAGVGPDGVTIPFSSLVDLDEAHWDSVVDTNLKGVFLCMKHELRQMRQQCSGVIVNTSSTGGLKMMPGFGAYGPSKAAVLALTRLAAAENKDKGIRVNVVAPGPTKNTGMSDRLLSCMKEGEGPPATLWEPPRMWRGWCCGLFGRSVLRHGQRPLGGRRTGHRLAGTSNAPGARRIASAHRLLHEGGDLWLFGGCQLLQREGDRPHGAFVKVRLVLEAKSRVSRLEFLRALEEADDFAILGIRGHPIPGLRREDRRAGFDDRMEPLGHGAIRCRHSGDDCEHLGLAVGLLRCLVGGFLLRHSALPSLADWS